MIALIPYSVDLRLGRLTWVTFGVMVLCVAVHWAQHENRGNVERAIESYCADEGRSAAIGARQWECEIRLDRLHGIGTDRRDRQEHYARKVTDDADEARQLIAAYDGFAATAPRSLDGALWAWPDEINPLRIITASVAHGSWGHLIGNLIFFFAFAPVLEVLIASRWKFVATLVATAFGAELGYALVSAINGSVVPSLGLSGVVMGLIGLGAYLMPRVRIRMLFWFVFTVIRFGLPAWLVAAWYVGWDAWMLLEQGRDMGVALSAHLGGAATGFLLGRFLFREHKQEIAYELDEAIEEARAERTDRLLCSVTASKTGFWAHQERADAERRADLGYQDWVDGLYRAITVHKPGEAAVRFASGLDVHAADLVRVQALLEQARTWDVWSRFHDCVVRCLIDGLAAERRIGPALAACELAREHSPDLRLADAQALPLLIEAAAKGGRPELALWLARDCRARYPHWSGAEAAEFTAVRLLALDLDRNDEARATLQALLARGARIPPGMEKLAAWLGAPLSAAAAPPAPRPSR